MNRLHTFLVATLIGVSYVPALLLFPILAAALHRSSGIPFRDLYGLTSSIVGLGLCFLAAPLCIPGAFPHYSRFLRESGVVLNRRVLAWLSAAVATTFLLAAAYGTAPAYLCGQLMEHFGSTPFTVVRALQPPLVEEVFLRGIVLGLLLRHERAWVAVLWSSCIFGLWHYPQGSHAMVSIAIASVFLFAVPRLLTASVVPGALAHFFTNANVVMPTLWGHILVGAITLLFLRIAARRRGSA
jgi:membrane protease YdiL (CAAX protease family)